MMQVKPWQWVVLALPIALVVGFLLVAAGWQIHTWGVSWIWGVFTLVLVGWRWLLVRWTRPLVRQVDAIAAEVSQDLETQLAEDLGPQPTGLSATAEATAVLERILDQAQGDRPIWEDWPSFWLRCQELVAAIAHIYHPEVKYPLLNIYVPQAYGLIRGTVDDVDAWMQKLSPVLNQVTVGQAYEAYELYQQLEPSARKLWKVWNWAQWLLNPVAALARRASLPYSDRATQQLVVNLGEQLRQVALRNLARQAIALYSRDLLPDMPVGRTPTLPQAKTQTVREILTQAESVSEVDEKPVNILLAGRTGAGKSSLINTLFQAERAVVDVLPSTDIIQSYQWTTNHHTTLTLWDTPGYEQVQRADLREEVLDYGAIADLLLLVTPALDPALQIDLDFLMAVKAHATDLPVLVVVTQVDRLRPLREWTPPYDWQFGDRPKEVAIREAIRYRAETLGDWSDRILPCVSRDPAFQRQAWGDDALALALVEAIAPAKQFRLARFLHNLEARTIAAAQIIDRYSVQMTTTQGLAALLKRPTLEFISTLTTGSPALAYVLAEKIPVEQAPIFTGKLQMAFELFSLLGGDRPQSVTFDLLALFPLLLENPHPAHRNAWAFGHALVEYWAQGLPLEQVQTRFQYYFSVAP